MYLFYSAVLMAGVLVALPYFLIKAWSSGKYVRNLSMRLGFFTIPKKTAEKVIWVHSVSVGETVAIKPFVTLLKKTHPTWRIVLSTTTITGNRVADARLRPAVDTVIYFPIDWGFSVRRALNRVKPDLIIIAETEIWPNLLRECRRRGIRTVLVNGRISERSFRRYRWVRPFMRRVLEHVDLFLVQTRADAERLMALGAPPSRLHVLGNLKYDIEPAHTEAAEELYTLVKETLGIGASHALLVAGSTMRGEEEMLVSAFLKLKSKHSGLRLILAPRHPERFQEVEQILRRADLPYERRSRMTMRKGAAGRAQVLLLDTMGELALLYRMADVAFVGGSLVPHGGHNILEPAFYGKAIVVGPYTHNFREIVRRFLAQQATVETRPEQLSQTLEDLLADAARRAELGRNAKTLVEQNRGVTQKTLQYIEKL